MADMLASISSFGAEQLGRPETTEAMTSLAPEAGGFPGGFEVGGRLGWLL